MPEQLDWRFCVKCSTMFWDGLPDDKGVCPDGGGHNAEGLIFQLPYDLPAEAPGQSEWRYCEKCSAMFFDGGVGKGACPADGGEHQALGFVFKLPHDAPPSATAQDKWRFCDQCYAMFWEQPQNMGRCPRGGTHQGKNSYMFVLPHTGVSRPATLHMWVDGLRCHSETPGFQRWRRPVRARGGNRSRSHEPRQNPRNRRGALRPLGRC